MFYHRLRWLAVLAVLGLWTWPAVAKPNIILIITDDMEEGLVEYMPAVRAEIIAKGASFTRAYFNDPLCCPSRAAMLTGKYVQNNKTTDNDHIKFYNAGNPAHTVAVWLQAAGYRTALVGKYLNGYPEPAAATYVPPGWDYWVGKNALTGVNLYYSYLFKAGLDRLLGINGSGLYYNYELIENGRLVGYGIGPEDYSDDLYKTKALTFLRAALQDKAPFFLWFSPNAPHAPFTAAARHADLYPDLKAPKPASFNEADVSDKPRYVQEQPLLTPAQIDQVDADYRTRARSLRAVDEAVQAFVDELAAAGQLADTYLVFVSDNGWLYGQHRLRTKGYPYEEVIKMPLYVRGPDVPAGSQVDQLVGNVDLAPTFAEWTGATPNAVLDGRSLAPLAAGRNPPWRNILPLFYAGSSTIPPWRGVRTADHVYVEYGTGEREFYDMRHDPLQLTNRAGSMPEELRRQLADLVQDLNACAGDACRALDTRAPLTQVAAER